MVKQIKQRYKWLYNRIQQAAINDDYHSKKKETGITEPCVVPKWSLVQALTMRNVKAK